MVRSRCQRFWPILDSSESVVRYSSGSNVLLHLRVCKFEFSVNLVQTLHTGPARHFTDSFKLFQNKQQFSNVYTKHKCLTFKIRERKLCE